MDYKQKYLKYKYKYLAAKKGGSKENRDRLQEKYERVLKKSSGKKKELISLNKRYKDDLFINQSRKKEYEKLLSDTKNKITDGFYLIYKKIFEKAIEWTKLEEYISRDEDLNNEIIELSGTVWFLLKDLSEAHQNYKDYKITKAEYIAKLDRLDRIEFDADDSDGEDEDSDDYDDSDGEDKDSDDFEFDADDFELEDVHTPIPSITEIPSKIKEIMGTLLQKNNSNRIIMSKDDVIKYSSELLFHFNKSE
jgi:hypothetical protein